MYVNVGAVRVFDAVINDKQQALKPLEEAAEVFGAWQNLRDAKELPRSAAQYRYALLDECADVIQATLNLVAALGCEDMRDFMAQCESRNRRRGRITDGGKDGH